MGCLPVGSSSQCGGFRSRLSPRSWCVTRGDHDDPVIGLWRWGWGGHGPLPPHPHSSRESSPFSPLGLHDPVRGSQLRELQQPISRTGRRPGLAVCPRSSDRLRGLLTAGSDKERVVEMTDFLARNWVSILFIGGMVFMHFGMHRGHGKSGQGGGHANESHEPEASTRQGSDTGRRAQGSGAEGAVDLSKGSPQDRLAPPHASVQVEDAPPVKRRRGGCC